MKRAPEFIILAALTVCWCSPASAQSAETQQTIGERLSTIEEMLRALKSDVSELAARLRATTPPSGVEDVAPIEITVRDAAVRGSAAATIAVIEFSDFQCPFCGRHAQTTYRDLQSSYIDTGKIKYVFRNFPLEQIHPLAKKAAEAAECARAQNKFWDFHDLLFADQQRLAIDDLMRHARTIGLNLPPFELCVNNGTMTARVSGDFDEARRLGLGATPAFLIGRVLENGKVLVTKRFVGAQPFQAFQSAIDSLLVSEQKK